MEVFLYFLLTGGPLIIASVAIYAFIERNKNLDPKVKGQKSKPFLHVDRPVKKKSASSVSSSRVSSSSEYSMVDLSYVNDEGYESE